LILFPVCRVGLCCRDCREHFLSLTMEQSFRT
jgi:hypothetical protein